MLEFILQHIFANHQKLSGLFQSYTILKDIGMNAGYEGPRKHGDLFSPDDHLLAPRVDLASRLAEYRIILENDVGENEDPLMRMTDMKPYLERLWVYKEWMGRFVQQ